MPRSGNGGIGEHSEVPQLAVSHSSKTVVTYAPLQASIRFGIQTSNSGSWDTGKHPVVRKAFSYSWSSQLYM